LPAVVGDYTLAVLRADPDLVIDHAKADVLVGGKVVVRDQQELKITLRAFPIAAALGQKLLVALRSCLFLNHIIKLDL
jgi:hypothetical protein